MCNTINDFAEAGPRRTETLLAKRVFIPVCLHDKCAYSALFFNNGSVEKQNDKFPPWSTLKQAETSLPFVLWGQLRQRSRRERLRPEVRRRAIPQPPVVQGLLHLRKRKRFGTRVEAWEEKKTRNIYKIAPGASLMLRTGAQCGPRGRGACGGGGLYVCHERLTVARGLKVYVVVYRSTCLTEPTR